MFLIPTPRKCMHMNNGQLNSMLPAPRVLHSFAAQVGQVTWRWHNQMDFCRP